MLLCVPYFYDVFLKKFQMLGGGHGNFHHVFLVSIVSLDDGEIKY